MYNFTYSVSFRVRHPSLDLSHLTRELGIAPRAGWNAGERRQYGSDGTGNTHAESYWMHRFESDKSVSLAECLDRIVSELAKHQKLFEDIDSSGGSLELFVGWFADANSGTLFPYPLLIKL